VSAADYTRSELEALTELAKPTPLDDWHSWSSSPQADEALWRIDPELASQVDARYYQYQRLNRVCKMLHLRGLLERKAVPSLGRGWWYRLIPMLRPERVQAGLAVSP
jgi:hypothetical protein